MSGKHSSLIVRVNMCLSSCGRVVAYNIHCKSWPLGRRFEDQYILNVPNANILYTCS